MNKHFVLQLLNRSWHMKQHFRSSHTCRALGNSNANLLTVSLFTSLPRNRKTEWPALVCNMWVKKRMWSHDFLSSHVNNVSWSIVRRRDYRQETPLYDVAFVDTLKLIYIYIYISQTFDDGKKIFEDSFGQEPFTKGQFTPRTIIIRTLKFIFN